MNADRLFALYDRVADAPDAVGRLRRFVLDLAVRGKLVEQDPADEPASELLERISDERKTLLRAKRIKRVVVDPVALGETPFRVPSTWQWTRLGNVGDWGAGSTPSRANTDFFGGDVTWLKSGELDDNRHLVGSEETITQLALDSCSFRMNRPGDVLIAMYGATIGKLAILAESAVTNQAVCGCTPFQGLLSDFFFLFLLSQRRTFQRSSEGGAQPNISKVKIVAVPFPLPPFAEQHRIVAKVDELMTLCDRLEEARTAREDTRDRLTKASLARLSAADTDVPTFRSHARFAVDALPALTARADQVKHLRQTILSLAVRGRLVDQDPADKPAAELLKRIAEVRVRLGVKHVVEPLSANEIPFRLPVGWRWSRIGELCTKTGSGSTPRGGKSVYKKTGVPFLRSQNIYDDGLRLADVACIGSDVHARMAGTAVRARDLLLNITGGSMGRCCRVPDDFAEANISQHVAIIRPAVSEMAAYLHKLVLSPHFQAFIFRKQTGAGRGGLPKNRMDRIPVAVPPLAEQRRIVARVDELMALCDRLETGLGTADDTRSRLLESILRDVLGSAQPERATDGHLGNEVHDPRVYGAGTPRQCTEPRSLSLRPIQDPNLGVTNGV